MLIIKIIAISALLSVLLIAFFALWPMFTERTRPGFWGRLTSGSYWNLSILALIIAMFSSVVFLAINYRDEQRSEERQLLKRVANAQEKLYKRNGSYGLIADVLSVDPDLYRQDFVINNGDDPKVSYLSTSRCQMLLLQGQERGPTCGPPRD